MSYLFLCYLEADTWLIEILSPNLPRFFIFFKVFTLFLWHQMKEHPLLPEIRVVLKRDSNKRVVLKRLRSTPESVLATKADEIDTMESCSQLVNSGEQWPSRRPTFNRTSTPPILTNNSENCFKICGRAIFIQSDGQYMMHGKKSEKYTIRTLNYAFFSLTVSSEVSDSFSCFSYRMSWRKKPKLGETMFRHWTKWS